MDVNQQADIQLQASPVIKKGRYPILLSLLFLLIGFGAGFLAGNPNVTQILMHRLVQNTPAPTSAPLPTPTINPIANWKPYTINSIGFSFRYPRSWFLNESSEDTISVTSTDLKHGGNIEAGFSIKRYPNPKRVAFNDWCRQNQCNVSYNLNSPLIYSTAVAGVPAMRQDPDSAPEDIEYTYIYIIKDRFIYEITGSFNINNPDRKVLLNQILSTFIFADRDNTINSSQSCTYKGKTYASGEGFKDLCNSCICQDGQVGCTLMACQ